MCIGNLFDTPSYAPTQTLEPDYDDLPSQPESLTLGSKSKEKSEALSARSKKSGLSGFKIGLNTPGHSTKTSNGLTITNYSKGNS